MSHRNFVLDLTPSSRPTRTTTLKGRRFGRLTVVEFVGMTKHKKSTWRCVCDCGNTIVTRASCLVDGQTQSCGCLRKSQMISQQEKSKKKRIAAQTWYLEHGEQARANNRKWVRENPEKNAAKANRRRVRKFGAAGSHTEAEWQILKRQYGNRCVGCRKTETELKAFGRRLVRDHIVALARGGTDDITNIQPLCHGIDGCNNKKHAKFHDFIIS